jgi:cell division protein FtsW
LELPSGSDTTAAQGARTRADLVRRPRRAASGLQTQRLLSYDLVFLGIVAVLIGLGLVMIFSASYEQANRFLGQSAYYLIRQLQWLAVGTVILFTASIFDYRKLQSLSVAIMALTVLALLAVLLLGRDNLGATRSLAGSRFQPSEMAKLTVTIYIAYWLTSKGERLRNVSYGLIPFAMLLGLIAALIVLQPDFDTTIIIVVTALVMFFVASADLKQLGISMGIASLTLYLAITRTDYAAQRIQDFLSTLTNPLSGSDQVRKSLVALANGGLVGTGLGDSVAKQFGGVPLPWTDSIFVIVGEELGLLGTLTVVVLFMALAFRGLNVARRSQDHFGMVLGCGITAWLAFQAFVNMAVNTATLPYGGLTLPFISYGGSSLVACMAAVGVLLSISHYGTKQPIHSGRSNEANVARSGSAAPWSAADINGEEPQPHSPGRVGRRNWWARLSNSRRARRSQAAQRTKSRSVAEWSRSSSRSSAGLVVKANRAGRAGALSRRIVRTKRTIARRSASRHTAVTRTGRRIPRRR